MEECDGSGSGESRNNKTPKVSKSRKRNSSYPSKHDYKEEEDDDEEDDEVWMSFNDGFRQVQSLLNRNRILIQQINENHRSKIGTNMVKNVALIQEMNSNISKIVSLYSDLSSDFSSVFHHRRAGGGGGEDGGVNFGEDDSG